MFEGYYYYEIEFLDDYDKKVIDKGIIFAKDFAEAVKKIDSYVNILQINCLKFISDFSCLSLMNFSTNMIEKIKNYNPFEEGDED